MLVVALDRLDAVHHTRGHVAGDALVRDLARRLADVVRPDDEILRLGSDQLAVLCHDGLSRWGAEGLVVLIREALRRPCVVDGVPYFLDVTVGAALGRPDDTTSTLLRDAAAAMQRARQDGGRCAVFEPWMRDEALRRHQLDVGLRVAVQRDELEVHYQPSIDLRTGRARAAEALLRWQHPRLGPVCPSEFVAVAEETDLIVDVGTWVLRAAMRQAVAWAHDLSTGAPDVAVNVSRRQLASVGFVGTVATLLEETGADAASICLEITETALTGRVEPIVDVLHALRGLGVRLAIDDFGAGHASLTYLARFPVDVLKIDRSFVAGLGEDRGSAEIVRSVAALGHAFDLTVVAEGVETQQQLDAARELGCDVVQGFLVGRPMPAGDVSAFLAGRSLPSIPRQRAAKHAESSTVVWLAR